jgi:hypothetical protein
MVSKRSIIVLLAGANLLLLFGLLFATQSGPAAFAQVGAGRAGDFVAVTAKVASQTYEVLYLLDVPSRKLHAFYPQTSGAMRNQRVAAPPRDLLKDFERK